MRPSSALLALLPLFPLLPPAAAPARAVWPVDGRALCTAVNNQWEPAIASDGGGGAYVVWYDHRNGGADIYGQHVAGDGTPLWIADGLAICTETNSQFSPDVVPDGAGGMIVVWSDQRNNADFDIYAQRLNAAGVPLWAPASGVPVYRGSGNQTEPTLVRDATGGVFIVWEDRRNGVDEDLYCRYVDAGGVPQWANAMPICVQPGDQVTPRLVTDGGTRAVIAWYDGRGADNDIYAQKINVLGAIQWAANGVAICTAAGTQLLPTLVDNGGGALIAWHDFRGGNADIYVRAVSVAGVPQGPVNGTAICTAPGDQQFTAMAPCSGGAIVSWTDNRAGFGSSDVYAQRVTFAGAAQWAADGVPVCTATGSQNGLGAVSDGADGIVMAWNDSRNGSTNYDIYTQRLDGNGQRVWTADGIAMCNAAGHQSFVVLAADEAGGVVTAWSDERLGAGKDVYAMRVEEGPVGAPVPAASVRGVVTAAPNPFRGVTEIRWELARRGDALLEVFDVAGTRVFASRVTDGAAGEHVTRWDARDGAGSRLPGGVYFVRLERAEGPAAVRKVVLIR